MRLNAFAMIVIFLASPQFAISQESADTLLTVRNIVIDGNLTTKDFIILREMKLKPGAKITAEALEHDQKRIYSLQLFNKVEMQVKPEGSEAQVVVHVNERWYLFPFPIVGIRYRDFDKLYYGAGLVHENFRGRNEKLFFSFALGFDRWVSLNYHNPKVTDDDDIFLGIQTRYSKLQSLSVKNNFYDQTNLKLGLSLGKRFGLHQVFQGWINYDVRKVSEPQVGRTVSPDGRDAYMSAGLNYVVDTRDVREYPLDGYLLSVSTAKYGFGESSVDFFRYRFGARGYSLLTKDISLGGRSFISLVGGGIVPTYHNVYFGYDDRIRGHFNTVIEGENIFGASTELRIPLLKPLYYTLPFEFIPEFSVLRYGLYFGVFADAGKIWNRAQSFSSQRWYAGYGAGFHFLLPYSFIVRTEYAMNTDGHGQFVLDFGASF